jgi:DinB superfamily
MLRRDLQQVLDQLDDIDRAAEALVAPLSDAQFFWQPNEGRSWSIAQCLEHLAIANEVYAEAVAKGIEAASARGLTGGGPIESTVFGRLFVSSMEPPVRRRLRAPGKIIPGTTRTREDITRSFREGHDRLRELVRAAASIDVNRATFANPFYRFVRVRVGTGLRVVSAHDRRHVWQAENVRRAPGFPTEG